MIHAAREISDSNPPEITYFFAYMLNVRSYSFWKLTHFSKHMCNHCVKIYVVHVMLLSIFSRAAVWFEHETMVFQGQRSTHWATDVTFPWVLRVECFVCSASFLGRFYTVEMNASERTLNNLCSQSLPAKGNHKTWKYVLQTFQFRLTFTVTKPQFAEIFRYYTTEAQIIQNRGFRSTLNESFYTVSLCLFSLLHCI